MPHFLTDDNCTLYYELHGKGRPVVLLHGWACNRHHFRHQLDFLRHRCQVLSYDLRGHGDSERTEYGLTLSRCAKDLRELIRHCALENVTLVGWSMGTAIILDYVRQFGCDNVKNLCFIDMTPRMATDDTWNLGLYGDYDAGRVMKDLHVMAGNWEKVAKASIAALFAKKDCFEQSFDWAYAEVMKNTPHVVINMWISLWVNDYREVLKTITVPTLITYGGASRLYSPEVALYMEKNIENAKTMRFEDCGHGLHMEDPARFNNAVAELIGQNV